MRNKLIIQVILALVLSFVTLSCSNDNSVVDDPIEDVAKPREDIAISRSEKEVVKAQNEFAMKLFNKVIESSEAFVSSKYKNVFISPLSASMALSMFANGAVGDTQKEIIETLGFSAERMDAVNAFNYRLSQELMEVDNTVKLSLSNSIWVDTHFPVKQTFIEDNKAAYGAEIYEEPLSTIETMNKINDWCNDKTYGLIPAFLTRPLEGAALALFNATYFKGRWAIPFDKALTSKKQFFNLDGSRAKVDMMNNTTELRVATFDEGIAIVKLPYGNGAYSMELIADIQNKQSRVGDFMKTFTGDSFTEALRGMTYAEVNLSMPKFDIYTSIYLDTILKSLGIEKVFDFTGDFSAISDEPIQNITIKQDAHIIVDEEKTEAAAVTGIAVVSSPMPTPPPLKLTVNLDKPFALIIHEVSTGAILFMGYVKSFE